MPGKHASVAIYTFLARKYSGAWKVVAALSGQATVHKKTRRHAGTCLIAGRIDQAAAQEGVLLYDEAVADAIARPGAHANIDILLSIVDGTLPFVEVEVVEWTNMAMAATLY